MAEKPQATFTTDAVDPLLHRACQMLEAACKSHDVPPHGVLLELPPRAFDRLVGTHVRIATLRQIKVRRGH